MIHNTPLSLLLFLCYFYSCSSFISELSPRDTIHGGKSSIIFTTLGRSSYNFDIYTLPIKPQKLSKTEELRITDALSVNFNGHFLNSSNFLSTLLPKLIPSHLADPSSAPALQLLYVTERNGTSGVYYDALYSDSLGQPGVRRSALEIQPRVQVPLLGNRPHDEGGTSISMKDRPSLVGEHLIYVSTHQDPGRSRTSWAAVYSTHLRYGSTRRLSPVGVADYSPAVSPSGEWTAVASYGEKGWDGEVEELGTDIYVFLTRDGSGRIRIAEHGGWPCWVDDYTIYFHRRSYDDGWWSVYRAILPRVGQVSTETVVVERITPPGVHAFTPATAPGNKDFIAVATRRPGSDYRHIELFDLQRKEFKEMTRFVSPDIHHLNPFISPDSTRIGYHRCRGGDGTGKPDDHLFLENLRNPIPGISLFRVDGSFPSFSPEGDRIAYVAMPGLYVMDRDGSNRREVFKGMAFSTAWDPVRKGVVYTNVGPTFATESTEVDIISINVDDPDLDSNWKKLTTGGENNAFPSPSPDGKWVVFRSGRSGHKNLYIMDAVEGERGGNGIHRLTVGAWSDTMCNWSPDREWIVFASDREKPGSGSFELFMIHPNGTGLRKVIQSGFSGRANHPWFSPDAKSIVFTSDYAAVSAEPISNPHHYQPYGDIFVAHLNGSGIQRMTHNSYEDGTPTWGPAYIKPVSIATDGPSCDFEDCHWLNINQTLLGQQSRSC